MNELQISKSKLITDHVGLGREDETFEALKSHPLDGELSSVVRLAVAVVLTKVELLGQTEVSDDHLELVINPKQNKPTQPSAHIESSEVLGKCTSRIKTAY